MIDSDAAVESALLRIRTELDSVITGLLQQQHDAHPASLDAFADLLAQANHVFVMGAGRSGLALRMTAMRLMHLGLKIYVVGEVTTPAIGAGDVLLTASGSGTTSSVVKAANTAVSAGARLAVITTAPSSLLAEQATSVIVVPAADKLDRSGAASAQYAGSLFEQAVVLIGDALFHALWQRSGASADDLWPRHANLE